MHFTTVLAGRAATLGSELSSEAQKSSLKALQAACAACCAVNLFGKAVPLALFSRDPIRAAVPLVFGPLSAATVFRPVDP